ncbi:MAG: peroxidase-related enzyme [Xanthomonadaceae bacterium]|nr:peroxidase-related enzyme [Xanthomonadaceae bacterium]
MSWITEIDESDAAGALAEMYEMLRAQRGKVSNILKVHSLRPAAMQHHLDLYMGLMFGAGGLSRRQRELIAVAVSQANRCAYCVTHHVEALARYERDADTLAALKESVVDATLTDPDRALVEYATRLTEAPHAVTRDEIDRLRVAGLADDDILLANLITAYFNFVNRIALGLGVEFTDDEAHGYRV